MKRIWQLLILGFATLGVPTTVFAQSAGFNFVASDAGNPQAELSTLAPTDIAGVIAQANWNNLDMANGSATSGLVYDNGQGTSVPSTINVTWASPNSWRTAGNNQFPAGPNRQLMSGYIDSNDQPGGGPMITVSNIDPALRGTPYDVYVYIVSDSGANRGGGYTLTPDGGSPIVLYGSTLANPNMHIEDPGTDQDLSIDGTYLRFTGLTATGFSLTADASLTMPNGFRAPVAAFQITPFIDIPGDVNGDQQVNLTDFHILRGNLFKTGQSRFQGDIAGADGIVNFADYREWKDAAPPAVAAGVSLAGAVPEPAAAMLMVMGVAVSALAARRRVRKPHPQSL